MSGKEQIKEGDAVFVPKGSISRHGTVIYLQPPLAVVKLQYGTRITKRTFRIDELTKTKIMTEKEARERNERETA